MTANEARLYGQLLTLLDSGHRGEREAALEKIFTLRTRYHFPKFGDLLHTLNNTVPFAAYQKLESDLAACLRQNEILRAAEEIGLLDDVWRVLKPPP